MNAVKLADKQRTVNSAIRSVEVEGYIVDSKTKQLLAQYANGELSARELERESLHSLTSAAS